VLAEQGDAADRIAEHLSHESPTTTLKHYVDAGIVEEKRRERGLTVIAGGRGVA
jgi:hypothetical protein